VKLTVDRGGSERAIAVKVELAPQAAATTTRKRLLER